MHFRACLDLHQGLVRQIVGRTLEHNVKINFTALQSPSWYAKLYKDNNLQDCHMVMLGPSNELAALDALKTYPKNFRLGGGIDIDNCQEWLKNGAKQVIITSYLFEDDKISFEKINRLKNKIGKDNIIIDLSAAKYKADKNFYIYLSGWRKKSHEILTNDLIAKLANYCSGFIIHAIDNEGLASGIDVELLSLLAKSNMYPIVYGGGVSSIEDIKAIKAIGENKIDFTVGSALDIFGGKGLRFEDMLKYK